jgi:hypothetical protein
MANDSENEAADFTPSLRFPVQITSFDVSDENPQNHVINGVNWLNGRKVQVRLRDTDWAQRKSVSDFHNDSSEFAPVTTKAKGIIVIENAYIDRKRSRNVSDVTVFSADRIVRMGDDPDKTYPISNTKTLAKAYAPRPVDPNDPEKGYKQNISIMHSDLVQSVETMDQLDKAMLDLIDPEIFKKDKDQYRLPGQKVAGIRVTDNEKQESKLFEIYGGFYKPQGSNFTVPKTRGMIAKHLENDVDWKRNRGMIEVLLNDPSRHKIEVLAMSTVSVARLTAQKNGKDKTHGRIMPATLTVKSSQTGVLKDFTAYSPAIVGVLISPKGHPSVIFCKPSSSIPQVSKTGVMSRLESLQFETKKQQAAQRFQEFSVNKQANIRDIKDAAQASSKPSINTPAPSPATTVSIQEKHRNEPQQVLPNNITVSETSDSSLLQATLPSPSLAKHYAREIGARVVGDNHIVFSPINLHLLNDIAGKDNYKIVIDSSHKESTFIKDNEDAKQKDAAQPKASQSQHYEQPPVESYQNDVDQSSPPNLDEYASYAASFDGAIADKLPLPDFEPLDNSSLEEQELTATQTPSSPPINEVIQGSDDTNRKSNLDSLDFADIDLDSILSEAYQTKTSSNSRGQ